MGIQQQRQVSAPAPKPYAAVGTSLRFTYAEVTSNCLLELPHTLFLNSNFILSSPAIQENRYQLYSYNSASTTNAESTVLNIHSSNHQHGPASQLNPLPESKPALRGGASEHAHMMPSDGDGEGGDSLTRNAFSVVRYSWKLILLPREIATSVRRDLRKSGPVLMPAYLARLKPAAKTQRMSQGGR